MKRLIGATTALAVTYLVGCGGNTTPPPELPSAPRIVSFEASKTEVQAGEEVTLSYEVEHASEVQLVDQNGEPVELEGDAAAGTVTLTPSETSFFVLRALGDGGRDTAFVQVAVGEDLQEVFLVAVPPVIDGGGESQLLWSAHRAKSAKIQTSAGQEIPLSAEENTGILDVTPSRTLAYTLVASGVDATQTLTATAEVKVRPVLAEFGATPTAANVGETLRFSWVTRGANEVTLTETTFGELAVRTDAAQVDQGTFDWVVPAALPAGGAVLEGQPLRFTLTVKSTNPAITKVSSFDSYVGDGAKILEFRAPDAVTAGKSVTLSWKTFNATRLQLLADDAVIHEPLPGDTASVADGSLTVPAGQGDVRYELRVWNHLGGLTVASRTVTLVEPPLVSTFQVPAFVNEAGQSVTATWTTQHATSVALRIKGGPVVYRTTDLAPVASGSAELHPGLRSTFVLEARNAAGDLATAEGTVEVGLPGLVTASPSPSFTGDLVTLDWDVPASVTTQLLGVPTTTPIGPAPGSDLYDLETHVGATELHFDDPDQGVEEVALPIPFAFPLAGMINSRFFVSTNGFVTFSETGAKETPEALDSGALPPMLAPFWQDLHLGEAGRVLYYVEGNAFPRQLVIQWDKVSIDGAESELTFQVQLFETGQVRFAYKTLQGAGTAGENASIGFRLNDSLARELGLSGSGLLNAGDQLDWFASSPLSGQVSFVPERSGMLTLFGQQADGDFVVYPARINPQAPGQVLITEAMVLPDVTAPLGQWIELANFSAHDADLSGTTLGIVGTGATFTLPEGTLVPAGGFLVVGQSTDPDQNGHAAVDLEWGGLSFGASGDDSIVLSVNGTTLSAMSYLGEDLVPNQSYQASEAAIDANGALISCPRTQTFGFNGTLGTPGAPNEVCFEYSVQPIAGDWEDILTTGNNVLSSTTGETQYTLPVPFPYFGQLYEEIGISSAGFITFGEVLTDDWDDPNPIRPSDPGPNGTVAPFWARLIRNSTSATTGLLTERKNGYTIVSWHDFRLFNGGSTQSKLHFQLKLFDSGIIEFHYGDMGSTTASSCGCPDGHTGGNSTIWLERLDGSGALPLGINQAGTIQPHTAFRFTPNQ